MCELLFDTDVLVKLATYGLLDAIAHPGCPAGCDRPAGLVGAARYSARNALKRRASDPAAAAARLDDFVGSAQILEPSDAELQFAAAIEEAASAAGGSLDVGESQLCAIAINRGHPVVLTGDKRAVASAEQLLSAITEMARLQHRIACFEQAMVLATDRLGAIAVRDAVLREPETDTTVNICFKHTDPAIADDFYPDGLASYIEHLRQAAPTVMLPGLTLALN